MKEYTIIRRRTVVQIQTDQILADTETEALEIDNKDQCAGDFHEAQILRRRLGRVLTSDDILEVTEVERA